MANRFSVVEFFGDRFITTPVNSYEEGFELFCKKFYFDTLLDEFVIVDEKFDEVIFVGSEYAK